MINILVHENDVVHSNTRIILLYCIVTTVNLHTLEINTSTCFLSKNICELFIVKIKFYCLIRLMSCRGLND